MREVLMKTAVVIIHGIGEQKPMDTLRGFVEAVIPDKENKQKYYSKPDRLSETFELRRLQETGRGGAHFYEYYWAYNVEGTNLWDVLVWLIQFALRRRGDVPAGARPLSWLVRILGITLILLAVSGVLGWLKEWYGALVVFGPVWCSVLIMVLGVQYFLVRFLGDAARYMSPRPTNIKLRQRIRSQGVRLLRALHERGEYDRIIVVGHSLGSVIGYDIITRLWQEYAESLPGLSDPGTQARIRECQARQVDVQPVLREELGTAGARLRPGCSKDEVSEFRAAQLRGFREQRRLGNPWCISDFVTLGSPLAHSMLLLASGNEDFENRKRQRELPTCPPQSDERGYAFSSSVPVDIGGGKKFSPFLLHDGAPFAVTRWTNLYVPAPLGLLGDVVGGPVAPALGPGVKDIPVRTGRRLLDYTILAHVRYWLAVNREPSVYDPERAPVTAIEHLRAILKLDRRDEFKPSPWPKFSAGNAAVAATPNPIPGASDPATPETEAEPENTGSGT
ncbi:MAG: hypothetical protein K8T20_12925 [Planctomycetes bacterium]|nr:hypothetical protein [Planctomycetota bacterium]